MDEKEKNDKKSKPWEYRDQTPPLIVTGNVPAHIEKKLREALEKYGPKTRK